MTKKLTKKMLKTIREQDEIADIFMATAISHDKEERLIVSQRRDKETHETIIEIVGETFAEMMKVYAITVEAMSHRDPFRAETTFFQNYKRYSVRCTKFAAVGR